MVLPGPTLPFNGGGLDFDWYQPLYENGNILSYPLPSTGAFTPSDLGAYKVPCPAENDPACVLCDINTDAACADFGNGITLTKPIVEPLVPAAQTFFDGTSGSLSYDYKGTTGSGGTFGYSHTLAESVDVKVGVKAKVSVGVFTGKAHASVDAELHNSNSWSGMRTSESETTSDTGITLSRSSGDSTQGYAFYPVFYTAQDGTIKVTHAAGVLESSTGRSFWAGLYGGKSDPALNLPSRFTPVYGPTNVLIGWAPNYLSSRKKLRGFFLRNSTLNPVSDTYDLLSSTPLAGDKVRVEANVYNYSTAVEINNLKVRFDVINYDSDSDSETKFTSCPGGATLQPQTGRCTVGESVRRPARPAPDGARRRHLGHDRLRPGRRGAVVRLPRLRRARPRKRD